MAERQENEFYTLLKEFAGILLETGEEFVKVILTYPDSKEGIERITDFETAADLQTQKIMEKLHTSLNTPLERGDLFELTRAIDDVVDQMKGMVIRLDLFNRQEVRKEAIELVQIIIRMIEEIYKMIFLLPEYKHDDRVFELALGIGDIEDEGDEVYQQALYRLFHEEESERDELAWVLLFDRMEYCLDACNNVARIVRNICLKREL